MNDVIVARHGESVAIAEGIANGDPARDRGLTEEGRRQAQDLGGLLAGERIDLCVTSASPRTQETGSIALARPDLPVTMSETSNDTRLRDSHGTVQYDDR